MRCSDVRSTSWPLAAAALRASASSCASSVRISSNCTHQHRLLHFQRAQAPNGLWTVHETTATMHQSIQHHGDCNRRVALSDESSFLKQRETHLVELVLHEVRQAVTEAGRALQHDDASDQGQRGADCH